MKTRAKTVKEEIEELWTQIQSMNVTISRLLKDVSDMSRSMVDLAGFIESERTFHSLLSQMLDESKPDHYVIKCEEEDDKESSAM